MSQKSDYLARMYGNAAANAEDPHDPRTQKKKKKKKTPAVAMIPPASKKVVAGNMTIIDDDFDWRRDGTTQVKLMETMDMGEDGPLLVIDTSTIRLDAKADNEEEKEIEWIQIDHGHDGSGWQEVDKNTVDDDDAPPGMVEAPPGMGDDSVKVKKEATRLDVKIKRERNDSDDDNDSIKRERKDAETLDRASESRSRRRQRKDSDDDDQASSSRPIKSERSDSEDSDCVSSARSRKRADSDDDQSPPRKTRADSDADQSPPRNTRADSDDDQSPARKPRDESPKRKQRDESPKRKKREEQDNDQSPPRRRVATVDQSPPRRKQPPHGDSDQSPPRRATRQDGNDDQSPPRRGARVKKEDKAGSDSDLSPDRPTRKTGLRDKESFTREAREAQQREKDALAQMGEEDSGVNAATVIRGKDGKKLTAKEVQDMKDAKKKEQEEKPMPWAKGLVQIRKAQGVVEGVETSKPFARTREDAEMNAMLRDEMRWGDPMLQQIAKSKRLKARLRDIGKGGSGESAALRPMYEGDPFINRFGIWPGHRWDGIDRSNGWEGKLFLKKNHVKGQQSKNYHWSAGDM